MIWSVGILNSRLVLVLEKYSNAFCECTGGSSAWTSTGAQAGQYERRLFVDGPAGLEREVGNLLSGSSGHFRPPVPVQVVGHDRLVHQPQDVRLVRAVDGRHRYVPDGPETTAVVQVFVLQSEEIPHKSPAHATNKNNNDVLTI